MNRALDEHIERSIRQDWFPGHRGTLNGAVLDWRKPETDIFAVRYRLDGRYLIVTGKIGAAVYEWFSPVSFPALATYGTGYFASKCEASEYGHLYEEWFEQEAREYLQNWIASAAEEDETPEERQQKLGGLGLSGAFAASGFEAEWNTWLSRNGQDAFGSEWYRHSRIGMAVAMRCRGHLIGLKMYAEQCSQTSGGG